MRHCPHCRSVAGVVLAVLLLISFATAATACGTQATTSTSEGSPNSATSGISPTSSSSAGEIGESRVLTVSAASSLKAAFTEIGKAFDAANRSKTTFNFDASGTLQKQIEGGAPVDVFASAALKQVEALREKSLVDAASVKEFAGNQMVLVVPSDSTLGITSFQDLARADVKRITYGDPKIAPHGAAAEEILSKLGLSDQVKPKVIYANNVAQALEYVSAGEVDAGIIFGSEAKAGGDKVKVVATADPAWYSKVAYPIALVSASKAKTLGQTFIDYVTGPEGQAILQKYGFLPASAQ